MRSVNRIISFLWVMVMLMGLFPESGYAFEPAGNGGLLELPFEDAAGTYYSKDNQIDDSVVYSELTGGTSGDAKFDPRPGKENFEDNLYSDSRQQGSYNTCWAFSSLACAEAAYNKSRGVFGREAYDADTDYSEAYFAKLIYCKSADYNDPLKKMYGATNKLIVSDTGNEVALQQRISIGASLMITQDALAIGMGPAKEEKYPYSEILSGGMPEGNTFESEAVFEEGFMVPTYDHDMVKKMVIKYGGAAVGYYNNNSAYNAADDEYYYNFRYKNINHAVVIVGWDDNCPKENFLNQPSQDGAWLVRNSQSARYSYFWMSYDTLDYYKDNAATPSNVNGYVYNIRQKAGIERLYEYDSSLINYNMNVRKAAVIFDTAPVGENETEYINGVTFKAYGKGVHVTAALYKNVDRDNIEKNRPEAYADAVLEADGYNHIRFDNEVAIREGENFAVVVEVDSDGKLLYAFGGKSKLTTTYSLECKYNMDSRLLNDCIRLYKENGNVLDCVTNQGVFVPRIKATSVVRDSVTGEIVQEENTESLITPTAAVMPEPTGTAVVTAAAEVTATPTASGTATAAAEVTATPTAEVTVTAAVSPAAASTAAAAVTEAAGPTAAIGEPTEEAAPKATTAPEAEKEMTICVLTTDSNNCTAAKVGEKVKLVVPVSGNYTLTGISSKKAQLFSGNIIRILRPGKIKIKTRVDGKKYAICLKIPKPKLISKKKIKLQSGDESKIEISDVCGEIKYCSMNPSVASVSSNGIIRALSPGKGSIIATAEGVVFKLKVSVDNR